ncbi:hypothetical protein VKT23_016790 [Stygiomarasmius scandens]|uniref:Uncharacterized protein n=1 Tax=Marasmiellus scandens TaxID=2682957 RepID=A0ABR1ITW4_9AGAR
MDDELVNLADLGPEDFTPEAFQRTIDRVHALVRDTARERGWDTEKTDVERMWERFDLQVKRIGDERGWNARSDTEDEEGDDGNDNNSWNPHFRTVAHWDPQKSDQNLFIEKGVTNNFECSPEQVAQNTFYTQPVTTNDFPPGTVPLKHCISCFQGASQPVTGREVSDSSKQFLQSYGNPDLCDPCMNFLVACDGKWSIEHRGDVICCAEGQPLLLHLVYSYHFVVRPTAIDLRSSIVLTVLPEL